ncbi:MAG: TlpA family protein disulfide reductase [Bacteroidetes bacterium]|nr:TlpA family protein disulfide reductase [Bacteroidota bacterium]
MKNNLLLILFLLFISCSEENRIVKIGEKVPDYTFKEVLNTDQKPFNLRSKNKPIIIEFWATWCSPCIPAMSKLEDFQKKFENDIDIITVSTDSRKNLDRYIENTNTTLKIAFDTIHIKTFAYKYIPHTILIDKNGIVKAITTPDKITEETIENLISGENLKFTEVQSDVATNFDLNKEYKSNDYQYKITSENKDLGFKNEIKRDDNNKPIALDFRNVSIYRLMTDIYELSSAARIYSLEEISTKNKYCFKLEQSDDFDKDLLQNAKEILNSNLDYKAESVEKEMDSLYILEIVDGTKLPKKSAEQKSHFEFRGPYYFGKKITSYNLIEYLENEVQKPIKDKTKLDYFFDIELKWNYEEGGKSLNRELEKYGLRINKSSKPEKIKLLVLTKK